MARENRGTNMYHAERRPTNLNPPARAFPAASRGVSEHKRDVLFFLRIEDSPQLAAESFNPLHGSNDGKGGEEKQDQPGI